MNNKETLLDIKHGTEYPYDNIDIVGDWTMQAARGILWNLSERRGIKQALLEIDSDIRAELVESLAAIIAAVAPQATDGTNEVDHGAPPELQWDTRRWPHTARGNDKDRYIVDVDSDGLFYSLVVNGEDINSTDVIDQCRFICTDAKQSCQIDYERKVS